LFFGNLSSESESQTLTDNSFSALHKHIEEKMIHARNILCEHEIIQQKVLDLEVLVSQKAESHKTLESIVQTHTQTIQSLENEKSNLQKSIEVLNHEKKTLINEVKAKENRILQLQNELDKRNATIEEQKNKFKELSQELQNKEIQMQEERNRLEHELKNTNDTLRHLMANERNKLVLKYHWRLPLRLVGNLLRFIKHPLQYYRMRRDTLIVRHSGMFDDAWYLQQYPDLYLTTVDLLKHYMQYGWKEVRNPNPMFNAKYYLENNPDVKNAEMNPLLHFIRHGRDEGRNSNIFSDTECFFTINHDVIPSKNKYPTVDKSILDLIEQSSYFDVKYYLKKYPEVRTSAISPVLHFYQIGGGEGKNPSKYFDTNFYLKSYADVAKDGVNPLYHFLINGQFEGRKPLPEKGKRFFHYLSREKIISHDSSYNTFLMKNLLTSRHLNELKQEINRFSYQPTFSIIIPVYNVKPKWLNECIESVIKQVYPNWELCIYDDASTNNETINCLKKWEGKDGRIKVSFGKTNKHISLASNEAIKMADGEFIALLDNDDELSANALFEVVKVLNDNPEIDFIYSDEDFITPEGRYFQPHFKTDFNLSLLLSHNYITHFAVIRRKLGDEINWFRKGYEGAQDHDLFLRITERTRKIYHIPKILYHWRQSETSTSLNYNEKSYADKAARKALTDYATRNNIEMELLDGPGLGVYRFKRKIITKEKVSIIVPFKDQVDFLKDCIAGIIEKGGYPNWELLLISNNSENKETFTYLEKIKNSDHRIKVLEHNVPFNFSAINNWAIEQCEGKYILLLNNDIKAISDGWLNAMVEHIQLENVGIVGAKLLYSDDTIQHAGVIIGIQDVAGHSHKFYPDHSVGYFYRPVVIQELSAVTGACLLTKKELWNKVGGLNEINLKIAFNDIDYCLNVRSLGFDIVYTPYAKLYHYESKSRGLEDTPEKQKRFYSEVKFMIDKWETNRIPDPFYNVNLTLKSEDFKLKL